MRWALVAVTVAALFGAAPAQAYSTRVHIVIANKIREALIRGDGRTVPLKLGSSVVVLSADDARAIIDHPLAFRAGAVGPDTMAFPGLTDPTHAVEQHPFEQCQLLYDAAANDEERAFAAGCFVHGATDALAHHFVNYMSGETFTLTPLADGRKSGYSNAIRHLTAESLIQAGAIARDPRAFAESELVHQMPASFLLRTYLDESSAFYKVYGARAKASFDEAAAAAPAGATLLDIVRSLDVAPADHLVLLPIYLREIDRSRARLRDQLRAAIASMQDWTTPDGNALRVMPGRDGVLGTGDDQTACAATCPLAYARYFTYVHLLEPRADASGRALPSAFDAVSDKLGADLRRFLPAYLETIQIVSTRLNDAAPRPGELDLGQLDLEAAFRPVQDWATSLVTADYEALVRAVVPEWILSIERTLDALGIDVSVAKIVWDFLQPVVLQVKDALEDYANERVKGEVSVLVAEWKRTSGPATAEFDARLAKAAPPGLAGNALDHFFDTGLFAESFNLAAAALARHEIVLPLPEDAAQGVGPVSFDTSYSVAWMQAGACEYLRSAILPLGFDAKGLLSLRAEDGAQLDARVGDDSPIECHDGSLSSFTTHPNASACKLVEVPALLRDAAHRGSVSRGYPPQAAGQTVRCANLSVPGLPAPAGAADEDADDPSGTKKRKRTSSEEDGGGCNAAGVPAGRTPWAIALGLVFAFAARRRARRSRAARGAALVVAAALASLTAACGSDTGAPETTPNDVVKRRKATAAGDDAADPASTGAAPVSKRAQLLQALGDSVWHGTQIRNGKERAYELTFRASSLQWAEVRNPFGPARRRELRSFTVDENGAVHSTVTTPLGWTDADVSANGRKDEFSLEVVAGKPRTLKVTRGGVTETYEEGPTPAPTDGLTATVRVFSSLGRINDAFCGSGIFSSIDYQSMLDFARGTSVERAIGQDVVVGAKLREWHDGTGQNRFAVTDVDGFDRLGGTELSAQSNFFVTYAGKLKHPGGLLQMRERDDSVTDGLWVFLDKNVGSTRPQDLFLEVFGFYTPEHTPDVPQLTMTPYDIPIEVILVRCASQIRDVSLEVSLGGSGWRLLADAPTAPSIDEKLFPPAL